MKKKAVFLIVAVNIVLLGAIIAVAIFSWYQANSSEIVFRRCIDSVVEVKAMTDEVGESFGTAVILTEDGYLVTNAHVVSYDFYDEPTLFDSVQIRFADKEEYEDCTVEKIDYDLDLAVLKLSSNEKLKPIRFAEKNCAFGERVFAIGNTSNYGLGISEGIVSVPLVNVVYEEKVRSVIQADIAISSGNSGGALLNDQGELVGIISFRTKDNGGKIIYGFVYSVPVENLSAFFTGIEE